MNAVTTGGGPEMAESQETDEINDDDHTPDTNSMNMIHTAGGDFDGNLSIGNDSNAMNMVNTIGNLNVENDMIIEADDDGTPDIGKHGEGTVGKNENNKYV